MIAAIPTYNRPATLRKSVVPHVRAGTPVRIYDASDVVRRNENKAMLRSIEREYRTKVAYCSERECVTFIQQLAKHGVSPALAHYALKEGNVGALRNRILLDTAGSNILMCDDDVVASSKSVNSSDAVLFRSTGESLKGDPTTYTNAPSVEVAHARASRLPSGSSTEVALSYLRKRVEAEWASRKADSLVTGEKQIGRVVAIQTGWVGEPPASSWCGKNALRGGLGAWQNKDGQGWTRHVKQVTYQPVDFLRTFYLGLDNTIPLPPFFPMEPSGSGPLGESLYGPVLLKATRNGFSIFLPEAVSHVPGEAKVGTCDISLSGYYVIAEAVREAESLEHLADLLEESPERAEEWAEAAEARIQAEVNARIASLAVSPIVAVPEEATVKIERPTAEQIQAISSYGQLIKAWPDMVRAAKIVRENGVSLTVPL